MALRKWFLPATVLGVVVLAAVTGCLVTPMRSQTPLGELGAGKMVRMLISVNHRTGKYGLALWCRPR
jgi:hypothetical protein